MGVSPHFPLVCHSPAVCLFDAFGIDRRAGAGRRVFQPLSVTARIRDPGRSCRPRTFAPVYTKGKQGSSTSIYTSAGVNLLCLSERSLY